MKHSDERRREKRRDVFRYAWDAVQLTRCTVLGAPEHQADSVMAPQDGRSTPRIANCLARQAIRDRVVFAVDVPNCPRGATLREPFAQVVAFLEQHAEMATMAAPLASHELDHQHGVKFEDDFRQRRCA